MFKVQFQDELLNPFPPTATSKQNIFSAYYTKYFEFISSKKTLNMFV